MASKAGQSVGLLFIVFGIYQFFNGAGVGGLWFSFIGWFLLTAAGESYARVGMARAFEGVTAGDVMTNDCPALDGNLNIEHFVHDELLRTGRRCFVITQNGHIAGLLTPHEVKEIDRAPKRPGDHGQGGSEPASGYDERATGGDFVAGAGFGLPEDAGGIEGLRTCLTQRRKARRDNRSCRCCCVSPSSGSLAVAGSRPLCRWMLMVWSEYQVWVPLMANATGFTLSD
jgi:hypothetical protein